MSASPELAKEKSVPVPSSLPRPDLPRIVFTIKGARRASICLSIRAISASDAVDPAKHVREQESVVVGEMPVERSAQLILLL